MTADAAVRRLIADSPVFLRSEALAVGWDDGALRRALRCGDLVRVRHGAYTSPGVWQAANERERHVLLALAVMRTHSGRVALSHHSATWLAGVESWGVPAEQVHVTRLDGGAGRISSDVVHHEGLLLPEDLVEVEGLCAVRPARGVLESATLLTVERGLVLADSALRQQIVTTDELAAQMRVMESWRNSLKLQVVARLADGRSGSVGESRCRYLFWSTGLPAPQLQYEVYDEQGLVGVCDFAWPELGLLGEFDGKVKYGALLREGETPSDAVFREKQREDRLRRATGFRVVRITWDMLSRPRETAALVRAMFG